MQIYKEVQNYNKVIKVCEFCNKNFYVPQYREKIARYCSLLCRKKGYKYSDKTKLKMKIAKEKNPTIYWKGMKFSKKHREKLSISHIKESDKYGNIHSWVIREKGKPKKCEYCGTKCAKSYDWANIDHKYRRILNDFIRLCRSCHLKYDYKKNLRTRRTGNQYII